MSLRFDGKVAVVTGSGGGVGRAYAIAFAERGAKVLVNDIGGSLSGTGSSSKAADDVVTEILAKGGAAVANYDSVDNGEKIIDAAVKSFGSVDILVNNAGIIRDVTLAKMTDKDWDTVHTVNLRGVYKCTKAAWPHMIKKGFGRIINISSANGLYGAHGQVNYSTTKSGILGFTKSCALEGAKRGVFSNAVCPIAASRMTETVLPEKVLKSLNPECVAPLVLCLCHEGSSANGEVIEAGGGWFAKVRWERSKGAFIAGSVQPEDVASAMDKITSFAESDRPQSAQDTFAAVLSAATSSKL